MKHSNITSQISGVFNSTKRVLMYLTLQQMIQIQARDQDINSEMAHVSEEIYIQIFR